jgi:hypothetical protein
MALIHNPDKPELEIEDWKLKICGCRFAPFFLKLKDYLGGRLPPSCSTNVVSFRNGQSDTCISQA